jgi:hypothetical protein
MIVLMTRTRVKAGSAANVEAAAERLFSAIDQAQPKNIRCASCKLPDGVTFVTLLQVEEGTDNPLPALAAYKEFQGSLKSWVAEPPIAEQLMVIRSYRFPE